MYLSPKWVTTLRGSTQGKRPVAGNDGCRGRGRLAAGGGRTRHSSPRDDRTGSRSVAVAADRAKLRKLKRVFQCRSSLQGFIYRIVKRLHSAVVSQDNRLGVGQSTIGRVSVLPTVRGDSRHDPMVG